MPGAMVKDWSLYHRLRRKGHSKESAAKIANASAGQAGELARKRVARRRVRRLR